MTSSQNKKTYSKFLKTLISTTAIAAIGAGHAWAQDANTSDEEAGKTDVIIVTGTRIQNPNLVQASQIQVIDIEESNLRNVIAVEELIRDLPGVQPSIGPNVNNGNGGAQTLNLRGLGSNRNLVLLDGRRIVPFGLGAVTDTNNIPVGLIERTDVVTGGATTVYGADAVAGVLNFVTRSNFEGAELITSYGATEKGDGQRLRIEALIGTDFADDRGNVVFSMGYQKTDPVLHGDRDFSNTVINGVTGLPGGSINSAPFVLSTGTGANLISNWQFDPNSGLLSPNVTRYNYAPLNLLQTPVDRYNVFGSARYDVLDNVEVYMQGFYTNTVVEQNLAPSAVFGNTITLPISNPFLTDGVRDQICVANGISAADCLTADGITDPNAAGYQTVQANLRRRFIEGGPRRGIFDSDTFQMVAGLRGDIGDTWGWDISGQYGQTTQVDTRASFGLFARVQQGLAAIDETTCVNPANGCVPINLFGDVGSLQSSALAFIDAQASTTTNVDLTVVQANFTGDMGSFKSPYSPENIAVALGGEYRKINTQEAGDFLSQQPGALLGAGAASPAVSGGFEVLEGYAEMIAPIMEGRQYVEDLTFEAGVRLSDYSTSGTSLTWKAGASWEVVPGYKARGVFQRAVRSPNIGELFRPVIGALGNFATDPCAGAAPVGNAALTAICVQQGAPTGAIGAIPVPAAGQISISQGGNPNLDVEKAKTFTAGIVVSPPTIDNLTFSLDYFNINITDAITRPAAGDIVTGCFGAGNPGLTFNASCQGITRNLLDGGLNLDPRRTGGVALPLSNLGIINTSGFDFALGYSRDVGEWGELDYSFNGTYTLENRQKSTPSAIDRECAGFYSPDCGITQSEVQFNQRLTWSKDIYDASLRHRYLSGTEIEPAQKGNFLPAFETIDAEHYFDLTLRATPREQIEVSLTINNLLDNDPPLTGSRIGSTAFNNGNTFPAVYDGLGRRYTAAVRLRF